MGLTGKIEQLLEEWTNATKARIRIVNLMWHGVTISELTTWKGIATSLRSKNYSIQLVVGAALGDILTSNTSPITRAKTLSSDEIIYCGMGFDDKAAYLTLAPYVAGLLSAKSVKLNLTNDSVSATKVEKTFGNFNSEEAELYIRAGVIILTTGKDGFYIAQGVNTYQGQSTSWNTNDNKTYLIQQRQIADFVYEGYLESMKPFVGNDSVDIANLSTIGLDILSKYNRDGFITNYRMSGAYREGNAIITIPEFSPIATTDFVGFKMRILIPN
jgi:hypothetical protein